METLLRFVSPKCETLLPSFGSGQSWSTLRSPTSGINLTDLASHFDTHFENFWNSQDGNIPSSIKAQSLALRYQGTRGMSISFSKDPSITHGHCIPTPNLGMDFDVYPNRLYSRCSILYVKVFY